MQWKSPHTILRLVATVVICFCAISTWWWKTHPDTPVKEKIIQVKQGDGYLTEAQCRDLDRGMKRGSLREKFGVPADYEGDSYSWRYPLREDHDRHCTVRFLDSFSLLHKGFRIDSVDLELVVH